MPSDVIVLHVVAGDVDDEGVLVGDEDARLGDLVDVKRVGRGDDGGETIGVRAREGRWI